jgi:hypothetical protein
MNFVSETVMAPALKRQSRALSVALKSRADVTPGPKSLEGAELCDALKRLAENFWHDCGIESSFCSRGRAYKLPEIAENELYRVAQEALCTCLSTRVRARSPFSFATGPTVSCWRLKITGMGPLHRRKGCLYAMSGHPIRTAYRTHCTCQVKFLMK